MHFKNRVKSTQELLKTNKLDALIISSFANIAYLTGYPNFSVEEREAYLIILQKKTFIITDERYGEAIKKEVPHFQLLVSLPDKSRFDIIQSLVSKYNLKTVGFESNNMTVFEYKNLLSIVPKLRDLTIDSLRAVKDNEELELIKKACHIGDKAFNYVLHKLKIGISEKEIVFLLEMYIKKHGGTLSFSPIVAFGENSAIPHHMSGNKQLNRKDGFILIDFGVKFRNYCSDMSRTVFIGKASKKQKEIYQIVLSSQLASIEFIKSCLEKKEIISAKEVDKKAREYMLSKGFLSVPHSVGHGIGLMVHELPHISSKSKNILEPGNIFSLEPGIYYPGFGGVRVEDIFHVSKNTLIQLTKAPSKLIIIGN